MLKFELVWKYHQELYQCTISDKYFRVLVKDSQGLGVILHSRIVFVHAPHQWEMTLQCNVISHWLGAYTKMILAQLIKMTSKSCKNQWQKTSIMANMSRVMAAQKWTHHAPHIKAWGQVHHSYGNGLLPAWHQNITWVNANLLSIWPSGTNFNGIWIEVQEFSS